MEIKEDAEKIVKEFSEKLEDIPDLEETWYITDNLNLTRTDAAHKKNARIDKDGNLIVKKADWI